MAYSVRFASNSAEDIETLVRLRLEFSDANNGPHPES